MEEHKAEEARREKEKKIRQLEGAIANLAVNITFNKNAMDREYERGNIAIAKKAEENVNALSVVQISKKIELAILKEEDTSELEVELKLKENSKTK